MIWWSFDVRFPETGIKQWYLQHRYWVSAISSSMSIFIRGYLFNSIVIRITHVMSIEYFNYFLWNSTSKWTNQIAQMAFSEQFFVIRTWLVNSRSYRLATASNAEIQNVFWNGSAKFGWWYRSRVSTKRRQLQLGRIRWHRRADIGPTWPVRARPHTRPSAENSRIIERRRFRSWFDVGEYRR